ncbi:MAG: LacI family transcriptional regulator [Clostridiales bacterium]|nr:LacI family transcriptional regulator [Clostridiales bacterium]
MKSTIRKHPMRKGVTLRDIAREVGVNTPTVSKALRGGSDLSAETVNRIRETAARMGYRVRERKNAAVRTVGIICPELMGSYYARVATQLYEKLRAAGYEVKLAVSDFDQTREEALLMNFAGKGAAGLVCVTENDLAQAVTRIPRSVPTVVIAANFTSAERDVICVDENIGMRAVADHLAGLGHTRIAYAGSPYGETRRRYLAEALASHSITLDAYVSEKRHGACGYELGQRILAAVPRPTAVAAEYDDIALGLMRAFSEAGLRVPEDISVTGFDDADFCRYLPVSLTSVNSHVPALCTLAVDMLTRKLADPAYRVVQSTYIKPTLSVRESTGKCFET